MTDRFETHVAAEKAAFKDELQRIGLDRSLVALEMKHEASSDYRLVSHMALVPFEYLEHLAEGTLTPEVLATALSETVDLLRPHGPTRLLGSTLMSLVLALRKRISDEERLSLALEAVRTFQHLNEERLLGRCLVETATVLRDGGDDYDALVAYDKAADPLGRTGDSAALGVVHYHRAVMARSAELYEEGLLHLEEAEQLLAPHPDSLIGTGIAGERAICTFESGDVKAAAATVDAWIASQDKNKDSPAFNTVLQYSLRARIRLSQGQVEAALTDLVTAAEQAAGAIRQHATLTFRASDRAQLESMFQQALSLALAQERGDLALGILACAKSISPEPLRPLPEAKASTVEQGSWDALVTAARALGREATRATVSRDANAMRALSERAGDLLDRAHVLAGSVAAVKRSDVEEYAARLQGTLSAGDLVVEYVEIGDSLWALAVRANVLSARPIDMTLGEAVVLAACFVQECNARQPCRALTRLGHALLNPVRDLLRDASRLCVILPHSLGAFPLHAVELDGEPLVTHVDVVYIPSVDFMEPRTGGMRRRQREALVVAVPNPRYEVLEPLPWAGEEADIVSGRFESVRLLIDDNATSHVLLQGLRGSSLLHAATHAAFEQQAPLLARLLLADRPVFAFEIALAGAPLDTVNLSGCHTASQRMHLGGEGEGLAAAFLSSGARAVIASRWPVDDAAASAFNDVFYEELTSSAGADPWTAANAAQRRMLVERQWSHPALWAPFVVLGVPMQSAS